MPMLPPTLPKLPISEENKPRENGGRPRSTNREPDAVIGRSMRTGEDVIEKKPGEFEGTQSGKVVREANLARFE
ncbi:unnamed protein product, partial [Mesorhabditis spiculigera]